MAQFIIFVLISIPGYFYEQCSRHQNKPFIRKSVFASFLAAFVLIVSCSRKSPEEIQESGKAAGEKLRRITETVSEKKHKIDNAFVSWWESFMDAYHGIDRNEEIEVNQIVIDPVTKKPRMEKIKIRKYAPRQPL